MTDPTDLANLFSSAPSGSAQPLRYRQGVIASFDQITLANTVLVGGATLTNLPLLGVAEATTLSAGSVVGLLLIGEHNGATTWAIVGRMVVPNTPEAADAITLLSQRVSSANLNNIETTTSGVYTDLATIGPAVTVTVGPSGRCLVFVGAISSIAESGGPAEANMAYEISGATTRAADSTATTTRLTLAGSLSTTGFIDVGATTLNLEEGLTPGVTTFTAKYRSNSGGTVQFSRRNITVFAL